MKKRTREQEQNLINRMDIKHKLISPEYKTLREILKRKPHLSIR